MRGTAVLLRVSGKILRTDAREGISTVTGKPWRIPFVTVLVGDQGVAEVNVNDVLHAQLDSGQEVDWLVDAESQGRYLSVRFVAPFPLSASATVRPMFTEDAEDLSA